MHERLKKIIFKKLDQDLGHAEIIVDDNNSIWFIDRVNKYWYLELRSEGVLWWRYSFFNDFFPLFGMERKEYEPVIAEWVEEVLKREVSSTLQSKIAYQNQVEEVLNRKVNSTQRNHMNDCDELEEVLKRGVSSFLNFDTPHNREAGRDLNNKVFSSNSKELLRFEVEKILSLKAGVGENKMKMKKIFKKFTSK